MDGLGLREQSYEMVPVGALKHHPRNPNVGAMREINESVAANGFYGAIVAQRSTSYVLAGNHRLRAAKANGIAEVPVTWVDCDDDEALRILLADNRLARLAHYDEGVLSSVLAEMAESAAGLRGTGFDAAALASLRGEGPVEEDGDREDDFVEVPMPWGVIVDVNSEAEQVKLIERMIAAGRECKAWIG